MIYALVFLFQGMKYDSLSRSSAPRTRRDREEAAMIKLNLGAGPHHLDGFVNLDLPEWRWEDGLPYSDGIIDAITEGHSLMYVDLAEWPALFAEFARVLKPGGIVRITEDATDDAESERFGGWHDAVTLTSAKLVRKHMRAAGLIAVTQRADTSGFRDLSLCQSFHGEAPKCFWIEGRKP